LEAEEFRKQRRALSLRSATLTFAVHCRPTTDHGSQLDHGGRQHSSWIVRLLEEAGHAVVLANSRKTRSIWQHKQKDDDRDAEQLARLGRADPSLLRPLKHRGEQTQRTLFG
jgi:hypothetical protein